jgi:hypothetical protein
MENKDEDKDKDKDKDLLNCILNMSVVDNEAAVEIHRCQQTGEIPKAALLNNKSQDPEFIKTMISLHNKK